MTDVVLIIIGMAAVTYGPRVFPFWILSSSNVPKRVDAFLKCVPAAAIGALVIPGIFEATPDMPLAALAGICFTLLFGLLRGGIIVPVLGSMAVAYFVLSIFS